MDVWIVINPILKVLLYAASFLSVGSFFFSLHFAKHLTVAQNEYCNALAFKAAFVGVVCWLLVEESCGLLRSNSVFARGGATCWLTSGRLVRADR